MILTDLFNLKQLVSHYVRTSTVLQTKVTEKLTVNL